VVPHTRNKEKRRTLGRKGLSTKPEEEGKNQLLTTPAALFFCWALCWSKTKTNILAGREKRAECLILYETYNSFFFFFLSCDGPLKQIKKTSQVCRTLLQFVLTAARVVSVCRMLCTCFRAAYVLDHRLDGLARRVLGA